MKVLRPRDLAQDDGVNGPAYVAVHGRVYDVSRSRLWKGGRHQVLHRAGRDLSVAMDDAPHGLEFIERFPVVGILKP